MVLRSRLDGYSYQVNDRVYAEISRLLEMGNSVAIYGTRRPLVPKDELEIEESRLIELFRPDWNIRA